MKIEQGRISGTGMGGFLNPPGHPEHTFSVAWGKGRSEGSASLSHAVTVEWLDETTKAKAKALLDEWEIEQRHVIDRDWVQQILGYFRNCYRHPGVKDETEWCASHCLITRDRNPMEHLFDHLGVHHIREFYPEFVPSTEDFEKAYWGERPVSP
jgi:hypothetical protein